VEVERRRLAADALWRLSEVLKNSPHLSQEIKDSLAVAAAEEASGRKLAGLLPPADETYQWESPTQIAERMGTTPNAVGKAITALGLRGAEGAQPGDRQQGPAQQPDRDELPLLAEGRRPDRSAPEVLNASPIATLRSTARCY
jgi:hypothetical protein